MKNVISKCASKLSHVRFEYRMHYLLVSSIKFLQSKYGNSEETFFHGYPFLLNSFLELSIRSKESILMPYSNQEVSQIFGDTNIALFNSQNSFLKNLDDLDDFGILFSLWEFEEQEDIFTKLYRYNYFFNFENEKLNLKEEFRKKFGVYYQDYQDFCCSLLAVCISAKPEKFWGFFKLIDEKFSHIKESLTMGYEEYLNNSISLCPNIDNIAMSLKISQSYPFIKKDNNLFLPLPHCCLTACTKSLLYRLTLENNKLRKAIGKEVLEEYIFHIVNESKVYDLVSPEVYFDKKKEKLSSDVLCFKNDELLGIECKLITPSVEVRYLDKEALLKHKNTLIDFVCQLYKALFVNYSIDGNDLPFIEKDKRYGVVLLFERMDFNHRTIMKEAAEKLNLDEDETRFLCEHVRFDALYDFEGLTFTKGNAIEEMKSMIEKGEIFNFSISKASSNKFYVHEDFL